MNINLLPTAEQQLAALFVESFCVTLVAGIIFLVVLLASIGLGYLVFPGYMRRYRTKSTGPH